MVFALSGSSETKIRASITAERSAWFCGEASGPSSGVSASIAAADSSSATIAASSRLASSFSAASSSTVGVTFCSSVAICLSHHASNDIAEGFALKQLHFGGAHQFQHRQKSEDEFTPRPRTFKKDAQVKLAARHYHVAQTLEHLGHRDLFTFDLEQHLFFVSRENILKDLE